MRWNILLAVCLMVSACGVRTQPESVKTIAAFEVPLPTPEDRSAFLTLVSEISKAEGLRVYVESPEELARVSRAIPGLTSTIRAAVWRRDVPEVTIGDRADHLGQAWITFARGQDTALADRFRERTVREIRMRWPKTVSLPVLPAGNIPNRGDLIWSEHGYVLNPSAAHNYGL